MAPEPVTIDPDITRAFTLPGWVYTSPDAYELARARVFERSWQFVGERERVRVPGQVYPFTLLDGCLNEPLLLTRDKSDALHCMSNVCTHRGTILCENPGVEKSLVCRYHGRRFDLDGAFRHMPEFEKVQGFPSEKDNLARVPFGSWGSDGVREQADGAFFFASLSPAAPLARLLAPMHDRVGWLPLHEFRFDASRSRDYLVRASWALYVENYLEGFHIPFVHASLNEQLNYGEYATELFDYSVLQLGVDKGGDSCFDLPATSPDAGKNIAAYYWWLFPNTMFNFYPWGLSVNVVRPLSHELTRVSFLSYVWRADKLDQGAGVGLDRVEREDEAVVEAVHKGLKSRLYRRGRYSPTREQGVHHFHRLLCAALFA